MGNVAVRTKGTKVLLYTTMFRIILSSAPFCRCIIDCVGYSCSGTLKGIGQDKYHL